MFPVEDFRFPFATVLFLCGVVRVASRLLSKLVGLYHRVIYVGGPLKGPRSTMTG